MGTQGEVQGQIARGGRFTSFANTFTRGRGAWTQKIGAAVIDQALFAGSNFLLNAMLIRWMPETDFGAFTVAYSWFLLPQNLYEAVLIEPMTIFGSSKYAERFKNYLGFVYYGHIVLGVLIAIALGLLAVAAYFIDSALVGGAIAGAAIASPFILTRWLARQPFYVLSRPQWSALGGLIYFIVAGVLIVWLHQTRLPGYSTELLSMIGYSNWSPLTPTLLTPSSALLSMGVGGIVASIILTLFLLKPQWNVRKGEIVTSEVVRDHVNYGKWSGGTRLLLWIPNNIYYIILPSVVGLEGTAALRALNYLILPMQMTLTAMMAVLLPTFVRTFNSQGKPGLNQRVGTAMKLMVGATGAYCLLLVVFGRPLMHFLADGKYDDVATLPLLFTMGIVPVITSGIVVMDDALRAMGGVKRTFQSRILPTALTLTVGVVLLNTLKLLGANLAALLTSCVSLFILVRFYLNEPSPSEDITLVNKSQAGTVPIPGE